MRLIHRVMVTGHRPQHFPQFRGWETGVDAWTLTNLKASMEGYLKAMRERVYPSHLYGISGMALGVDQWFAEVCNSCNVPWLAYVPCAGQERKWPKELQDEYHRILGTASSSITLADKYTPTCMLERNVRMIRDADACIAVWSGKKMGGTYHAVTQAQKKGMEIHIIDPSNPTQTTNL